MTTRTGFNFMSKPDTQFRKVQGWGFWSFNDPVTGLPSVMRAIGSCTAELDLKNEYLDLRDNGYQRRDRIGRRNTMSDATVKLSIMQFDGAGLTQMLMSPFGATLTQAAGAAQTTVFQVSEPYQLLEIVDANGNTVFDVTNVVVTDAAAGAPATLVPGVDYVVDNFTGLIQVRTVPASKEYSVSWAAPAISATQGQPTFALMQNPEQTGRLIIRTNNLIGGDLLYVWPKVQFTPPTSVKLIGNGNDLASVEIEAVVLADSNHPGRQMGYATLIM